MALMGSGLLVASPAATSGIMTVAILAAALAGGLPLLRSRRRSLILVGV